MSVFGTTVKPRAGLLGWILGSWRRSDDIDLHAHHAVERLPQPGPDTLVIRAPEDLSSPEAVRTIYSVAKRAIQVGSGPVCIDLGEVTRADTKIVACLIVLRRAAERARVKLDIRLSSAVDAWTGLCRVQGVLTPKPAAGHTHGHGHAPDSSSHAA